MIGIIPACMTCENYKILDQTPWGACKKCSDKILDENFQVPMENISDLKCGYYKYDPKRETSKD